MEAYTDFAGVYDIFMDETPYGEWADFLVSVIKRYGVSRPVFHGAKENQGKGQKESRETGRGEALEKEREAGAEKDLEEGKEKLRSERDLVLDLGCGTGALTELLYQRGYDMIGVDISQEMLGVAAAKREKTGSDILYLCQDMRELDLYSTVGTIVSVCDSVNYLLEEEEVGRVFSLVKNYLYPGGLFVFDFNTVYKYGQVIGDATIAENRESCSFIWENYYHEKERINEYDLTVFAREPGKELFRRFSETHFQKGYTLEEMRGFVEKAGLEVVLTLDADTHEAPGEFSERIYVAARKKG